VRFPEELAEFDVFRERWDARFAEHFDDTNHLPLTEWEESEWRAPGRFERTYLVHGTKVEVLFSNAQGPGGLSFTLWYDDPGNSAEPRDLAPVKQPIPIAPGCAGGGMIASLRLDGILG
jgi:hypothetical protein